MPIYWGALLNYYLRICYKLCLIIRWLTKFVYRSKLIPENQQATRLLSSRLYKENRVSWNEKSPEMESQKEFNTNWATPVWSERQPSRNWSQTQQGNFRNGRKVSAKQHYLSVARYVAGQSTNLSSRYRKYCNFARRILTDYLASLSIACMLCWFCYVIARDRTTSLVQTIEDKVISILSIKRNDSPIVSFDALK